MKTKIKLNIQELSPEVSRAAVVIYDKDRKVLQKWSFQGNATFIVDLPIDTIEWFNVWTLVNDSWSIMLGGVPEMVFSETGEEFLEINDKPQVLPRVHSKSLQITGASTNMVNHVLGNNTASSNGPTLPQMAKSLGASVVGWAKEGFTIASTETLNARLAICKGCDFWDQAGFSGSGRCSKCGCSTQAKLRMATSSCPLDPPKWGPQ